MLSPSLDGGTCANCGVVVYPHQESCPRCRGEDMRRTPLSGRGRLWTWTVQRYAPKSPPYTPPVDGFAPFAVGYVELPEGVRVEGIVHVDDFADLAVGMPVHLSAVAGVPHFQGAGDG